jgi:class 3 adenylate cyclase
MAGRYQSSRYETVLSLRRMAAGELERPAHERAAANGNVTLLLADVEASKRHWETQSSARVI